MIMTGRGDGSQSPGSCGSILGLCDAPVSFEQPAEVEWAAGDIPDAIIDFFEADICADADV